MTTINPRSITEAEAPFLPESIEDLAELADLLLEAGHSPAFVQGLCGWTALKAAGQRDQTSSKTRAKYRKALADLAESGPGPRRRSQAGLANVLAVAGVTAAAAAGVATRDPKATALVGSAVVYITYTAGDDESAASPGGDLGQSLHNVCALRRRVLPTSYTPMEEAA